MFDCGDIYDPRGIIDCVKYAPIADANAPVIAATCKFHTATWARLCSKEFNRRQDAARDRRVEALILLMSGT